MSVNKPLTNDGLIHPRRLLFMSNLIGKTTLFSGVSKLPGHEHLVHVIISLSKTIPSQWQTQSLNLIVRFSVDNVIKIYWIRVAWKMKQAYIGWNEAFHACTRNDLTCRYFNFPFSSPFTHALDLSWFPLRCILH